MTHTPGPWVTDAECGNETVLDADGLMVADCAIFGADKRFTPERAQANARLIAAAPDMLAALKAALTAMESHQLHTAQIVRAAIAKATPQQGEG